VHPRTRARIEQAGFAEYLEDSNIFLLPPVGYLEMLGLMAGARIMFTDSGGIQEETTALGRTLPHLTREHVAADHRGTGDQHRGGPTPLGSFPPSPGDDDDRERCRLWDGMRPVRSPPQRRAAKPI
jgi:hypothetical protein